MAKVSMLHPATSRLSPKRETRSRRKKEDRRCRTILVFRYGRRCQLVARATSASATSAATAVGKFRGKDAANFHKLRDGFFFAKVRKDCREGQSPTGHGDGARG